MLSASLSSAKIEAIVQYEPLFVVCGLVLTSYVIYKIVFRTLSSDRRALFKRLFKNVLGHLAVFLISFALFQLAGTLGQGESGFAAMVDSRVYPYLGFLTIIWGSIVFVKTSRIFAFEYLFLTSMRAGVPVLLVNILSLGISMALASWIATEVFAIRLVPVLATSALISVILGLALQDTLGNLFAGVALQFDKPYEIGDWVEVQPSSGQKWIGQVQEITWRSTVFLGFMDEVITIPNRAIAQSEVATWGAGGRPFYRGISYRIPFGRPVEEVRKTLLATVRQVPGVLEAPNPNVYVNEIGDSWMNFRVVFCIQDYGSQIRVLDRVNTAVIEALARANTPLATPAMRVEVDGGMNQK